jgi:hypothetical protein
LAENLADNTHHKRLLAMAAPSTSACNFAQTVSSTLKSAPAKVLKPHLPVHAAEIPTIYVIYGVRILNAHKEY